MLDFCFCRIPFLHWDPQGASNSGMILGSASCHSEFFWLVSWPSCELSQGRCPYLPLGPDHSLWELRKTLQIINFHLLAVFICQETLEVMYSEKKSDPGSTLYLMKQGLIVNFQLSKVIISWWSMYPVYICQWGSISFLYTQRFTVLYY